MNGWLSYDRIGQRVRRQQWADGMQPTLILGLHCRMNATHTALLKVLPAQVMMMRVLVPSMQRKNIAHIAKNEGVYI